MPGWEKNSRYPLDQIPSQLLYFCVLFSASPSILGPGANGAERLGVEDPWHPGERSSTFENNWNIPVMWHVYSNYIEKVNRCSIIAICITEPCIHPLTSSSWSSSFSSWARSKKLISENRLDDGFHRTSFWLEALVFIAVNYTSKNGKAPIFLNLYSSAIFFNSCHFCMHYHARTNPRTRNYAIPRNYITRLYRAI